ncbi:MAG: hypothetical protein M1822_000590 [Bathelium mastoideum]|nr:MAG: hypothetical protein M1822_000590 [Bathelium mastoideum]
MYLRKKSGVPIRHQHIEIHRRATASNPEPDSDMGPASRRPNTASTNQATPDRSVQEVEKLTPETYARRVQQFSRQTASEGIYSGLHYGEFGEFLVAPYRPQGTQRRSNEQESEGTSVVVYDLAEQGDNRVKIFSKLDELRKDTEDSLEHTSSRLLFLNGFVHPSWLSYIGSQYDIDPEFFYRHLDLSATLSTGIGRYTYLPHLPASAEMFQLRIINIGEWDTSRSGLSVNALRKKCQASMSTYLERLKKRQINPGQSMVRRFFVHNQEFFSMEQLISVVVTRQDGHWTAVIWSDSGADLNKSESGPWLDSQRELSHTTVLHPIFQHRGQIALEETSASDFNSTQAGGTNTSSQEHIFSQSATQLSKNYGRLLKPELMSSSPLYALQEVLSFSAAAEWQFLNLVEQQVVSLTKPGGDQSISELLLLKNIMEDHRSAFQDSLDAIKALRGIETSSPVSGLSLTNSSDRKSGKMPSSQSQSQPTKIEAPTIHLFRDYDHILGRLKTLSDRCSDGITILSNQAMYRESQKPTEQAESFGKLTALAFFFATLSFTTIFFGITVRELSQSKLGIWVWLILTVPVLGISVLLWLLNLNKVWEQFKTWSKTGRFPL